MGSFGSFWLVLLVVLSGFDWFWLVLGGFGWFYILATTFYQTVEREDDPAFGG